MFDAIWATYAIAGRLPEAERARAPLDQRPVDAETPSGPSRKTRVQAWHDLTHALGEVWRGIAHGFAAEPRQRHA